MIYYIEKYLYTFSPKGFLLYMLSDITLGQYFPGKSLVHKLDPRVKILSVILLVVTIFLSKTYAGFALVFAVSFGLVAVSHIQNTVVFQALFHRLEKLKTGAFHPRFYHDSQYALDKR